MQFDPTDAVNAPRELDDGVRGDTQHVKIAPSSERDLSLSLSQSYEARVVSILHSKSRKQICSRAREQKQKNR